MSYSTVSPNFVQDGHQTAIYVRVSTSQQTTRRTASGFCKLFEDLQAKKVRLVSLRDSVDLGNPSGRLIANVLASVAAYETKIRFTTFH